MLMLGCTRVEIGLQSIYNEVLKYVNRGHTVKDTIESFRIMKDLGFKITAHYMPGLPLTTTEMDVYGLRQLFENQDFRPDMLKIYPCMVMKGTALYNEWINGKFKPITTQIAGEIIAEFKGHVPEYCRIVRVQRDIPTYITSSGVDRTNLRQYIDKILKDRQIKCRCIRCREAGIILQNKMIELGEIKIKVNEYYASMGREFFISAEDDKNDILFGYCRLRFPSESLRDEITESSVLIRELHVYSPALPIGVYSKSSFQHRGIGKALMNNAEKIAHMNKMSKIVVIAGIGAREYFRKLGYEKEGVYMVKYI
jgi:elongator complex protein 3